MDDEKAFQNGAQYNEDSPYQSNDLAQQEELFEFATPEEEAAVIRKLDYRLLPFVFVLYSLSILDRSNLGNAKLAGLEDSIDLGGNRYNWLGTIFYIAYILSQWTIAGWKQFSPHRFAAFAIFFWGLIASVQAAVTSWAGLMALRTLLGIAEAMYGPGVPLYLSYFYPREQVGFRHGVFISGAAMANAYGGALAYGIVQINGSIAPWQILFLIEGLPTIVLAVVAWFVLPDSISDAKFLTEREKAIAKTFVAREQKVDEGSAKTGVRFGELFGAFKDPKNYLPAIMYFSVNVSYASLPLFVPTIIAELGTFSEADSEGLSAPPYFLVFLTIIACSFLSDRFKTRSFFISLAGVVSGVGFLMLGVATDPTTRYIAIFLAVQSFVCVSLLLSWSANINRSESRRTGGYVILATVGQCGPVLGTNIFQANEEPFYREGMWISCAFCFLIAIVSQILAFWLRWERRRDGNLEREGLNADATDGFVEESKK